MAFYNAPRSRPTTYDEPGPTAQDAAVNSIRLVLLLTAGAAFGFGAGWDVRKAHEREAARPIRAMELDPDKGIPTP
jgi:hypothetical protein